MASLLRLGNYISHNLLKSQYVNSFAACSTTTHSVWNTKKIDQRTFSTENAVRVKARQQYGASLRGKTFKDGLQYLDSLARRLGRIPRVEFDYVFQKMKYEGAVNPLESLLMLRSCGALMSDELPEMRNELMVEVLDTLKSLGIKFDVSHFNAILKAYLENEYKFNPVEFLSEMERLSIIPNRVTYQRLIEGFCQIGDMEGARKILQYMKEKDISISEKVFNSLVMGHGRDHDLVSAKGILTVMRNAKVEPNSDTYLTLLCAYAENGDITALQEGLAEVEAKNIRFLNMDYFDIIYTLAKHGHAMHIDSLVDHLKNTSFNFINECIIVMQKLVGIGHHEVAFQLLKRFEPYIKPNGEVVPVGNFFLRQVVQRDVEAGKILEYAQNMKQLNLHPFALERAAEFSYRNKKLDHFLTFLNVLRSENFPIRPHYFAPFMIECGKTNNFNRIYDILKLMMEYECPATYQIFADYIFPSLMADSAVVIKDVFSKLKEMGYEVNDFCGALVEHLVDARKLKEAVIIADDYSFKVKPHGLYFPLAHAYADTGDVTSTVRLLDLICQCGKLEIGRLAKMDWTGMFLTQCFRLTEQKQAERMERIVDALRENNMSICQESYDTINQQYGHCISAELNDKLKNITNSELTSTGGELEDSVHPRNMNVEELEAHLIELRNKGMNTRGVLRHLLINYCRLKDLKRVEEITAELDSQGFVYSPAMYAQLMDVYIENEDVDRARDCYNQAKEVTDFLVDDYKVLKLIALLFKKDLTEEAISLLEEVQPKERDPGFLEINLWRILNVLAEKGDEILLEKVFKMIEDKKCCKVSNVMLGPLIKVHFLKDDMEKVVAKFEEFAKTYKCTPWRHEVLVKLIEKEDQKSIQKIIDLNDEIHGEMNTLHDLAFSFIDSGKPVEARKVFQTPGLRGLQARLERRCERFLEDGKLKCVQDLIDVTSNLFDVNRDRLYQYLIRAYQKNKDAEGALSVWTTMQEEDVQPSAETMIFLAKCLKDLDHPVPFEVPDERAIIMPPERQRPRTTARNVSRLSERKLSSESTAQVTDASTQIQASINEGNLQGALRIAHGLLDKQLHPPVRQLKYLLNELARKGDVDSINEVDSKLTANLKKAVMMNAINFQAHIHRGTYGEVLQKLENNAEDTTACPAGVFFLLLKTHPDLIERVEKLAREYTKHDYYSLLNVVWMHHFINENTVVADRIFNETAKFSTDFGFRNVLREAGITKNISMLERLLGVLKKTQLPSEAVARVFEEMMNIQLEMQDVDGAANTLERAKKDNLEQFIHPKTIQKLSASMGSDPSLSSKIAVASAEDSGSDSDTVEVDAKGRGN